MDQAPMPSSADAAPPGAVLSGDRSQWPPAARTAYLALLRELDSWCRHHGWPPTRNASVAEEAVRQAW